MDIMSIFQRTGAWALEYVREAGRMFVFFVNTLYWLVRPPIKFGRVLRQVGFLGSKSVPLIVLTGGFTGMILSLQLYYTLRKFGAEAYLGPAVALSLIRELGPVLAALMITGRAGSALAAEIGIMRITEQIDALESMSLSPYRYLMVPSLIGAVISFPLLVSIFDVVGIYGGYMVGVNMLGLSSGTYFSGIHDFITPQDINDGLIKSLCFGVVVVWVSSFQGFTARHGAEGVSRATTMAVIMASTLILVWDYFLNSVML